MSQTFLSSEDTRTNPKPTTRKFKDYKPASGTEGLAAMGDVRPTRGETVVPAQGTTERPGSSGTTTEPKRKSTSLPSLTGASDQGLAPGGSEHPSQGETARRPPGRCARKKRRDSSEEDQGGDEKRLRQKASTTPEKPTATEPRPSTSGRSRRTRRSSRSTSSSSAASSRIHSDDSDIVEMNHQQTQTSAKNTYTNSTSYAALESVPMDAAPMPSPPTPTPEAARSYAAALASPPTTRPGTPAPARRAAGTTPAATTAAQATTATTTKGYPPIIIEALPDWVAIFANLKSTLGHALSVKPLGTGFRFACRSVEEFRAVQRALTEAATKDRRVSWHCYAMTEDLPLKVAIKGLAYGINPAEIKIELEAKGFSPLYIKEILPRRGSKGGPTYYALLEKLSDEEKKELYSVNELLNIPNVRIEGWAPRSGTVPQCHRCQMFGHASGGCHRPPRCVKCAEEHFAPDCQRNPDVPPKCANCKGNHVASSRKCPHYLREARKRGIRVQGPYPRTAPHNQYHQQQQQQLQQQQRADQHINRLQQGAQRQQRTARSKSRQPKATVLQQQQAQQQQQQQQQAQPGRAQSRYECEPPAPERETHRIPQSAMWPAQQPQPTQPSTLAPEANMPVTRGEPLPQRKRRRRRRRRARTQSAKRSEGLPTAASTPLPSALPIHLRGEERRHPTPAFIPIQVERRGAFVSTGTAAHPEPRRAASTTRIPTGQQAPSQQPQQHQQQQRQQQEPRHDPRAQQQYYTQRGGTYQPRPIVQEGPPPPPQAFTPAGSGGNPMFLILGILTELLVSIAAGGDLQEAARRGLAFLSRFQYGC